MRRRRAASSTGSMGTRSRRCCGARWRRSCRRDACRASPTASSSSASASGWRSGPRSTGAWWPRSTPPPVPPAQPGQDSSTRRWHRSTAAASPPGATSTSRAGCAPTGSRCSTAPLRLRWPMISVVPCSLWCRASPSRTDAGPRRRSSPRRSSRRPVRGWASLRHARWRRPSGSTRTVASPTCAPTAPPCPTRRWAQRGGSWPDASAPRTCRPSRASTPARSRTRKRRTRPSAPRARTGPSPAASPTSAATPPACTT